MIKVSKDGNVCDTKKAEKKQTLTMKSSKLMGKRKQWKTLKRSNNKRSDECEVKFESDLVKQPHFIGSFITFHFFHKS